MMFKIPLPPSDNQLYLNSSNGRAKTAKYLKFLSDANKMVDKEQIKIMASSVEDQEIVLFSILCLHKKTIFCKNGKRKKFDITNRIKASNDLFSKLTGIDDMFISRYCIEYEIISDKEKEYMELYIDIDFHN